MARTADEGDWVQGGAPVKGVRGWALVTFAVLVHIFGLRWLRAPGWKDKLDAREELSRLVREHGNLPYDYWLSRIGQVKRIEFTSRNGVWYQATVEPIWDAKPGGLIRVFISLDDGGVGAYHPLGEDLLIEQPTAER